VAFIDIVRLRCDCIVVKGPTGNYNLELLIKHILSGYSAFIFQPNQTLDLLTSPRNILKI